MKKIIGIFEGIIGATFALILAYLWLFGGITGVVIGVVREQWVAAILSAFVPAFGALYSLYVAISALLGGGA